MRRKKSAYSVMFGVTEVSPLWMLQTLKLKGNYQTLTFVKLDSQKKSNPIYKKLNVIRFSLESLILAQNERWRRA